MELLICISFKKMVIYKPHYLIGEYKDCLECHVENDLLLVYIDEEQQVIKLVRLGTHSDLFR